MAYTANRDRGTQGCKPHCRSPKPLKALQEVLDHRTQSDELGRPDITAPAAVSNAVIGVRPSELPTPREIPAFFDADVQEHAQDRPSERGKSKSTGRASAATSTPAASTPSKAGKSRAKKRRGTSDDGEDGSGRGGSGSGGKGGEPRMKSPLACPFYILDPHRHQRCRSLMLGVPSAVTWHIQRSHLELRPFCDRCWKVFESDDRLRAHKRSSSQCSEQPFHHHWARPEDWDAVQQVSKRRFDAIAKWHAIYKALFGDTQWRQPIFCTATGQDIVDKLPDFRDFFVHQNLAHSSLGVENFNDLWPTLFGWFVDFFRVQERSWIYPAQTSGGDQWAGLQPGSSAAVQNIATPQTADRVFRGDDEFQSAGLEDQGMFQSMQSHGGLAALNPLTRTFLFGGHNVDEHPELPFPGAYTGHAPGSADFAMQHIVDHVTAPEYASQMVSQTIDGWFFGPPIPPAGQPFVDPLQDSGMATFPQGFPPQTEIPQQMPNAARGSRAAPNTGQWGQNMEDDSISASFWDYYQGDVQ